MKLRDSLKIIAIIMLIESVIFALRQPFMSNFDTLHAHFGQFATIAKLYYLDVSIWLQTTLYVLFAGHIVWLGSRIPSARFGSYFVLDAIVAIINAIVVALAQEFEIYGFYLKIVAEAAAIVTCFYAGWTIFKDLHIKAVQTICFSYMVLSARHLLYCFVLAFTLFSYGVEGLSTTALQDKKAINIAWMLLIPLFLISRYLLFIGAKRLKENADEKEKEREEIAIV